jgi:hypothetical protein
MTKREFRDVRGAGAEARKAMPVDKFMQSLEALQKDVATEKNQVWQRVADGTLVAPPAEAAVQGVLLPRQVVHVRVRARSSRMRPTSTRSTSGRASTSSTGCRTSPTRPATPAIRTTST